MPIWYEPAGCQRPSDDYTRLQRDGFTLNARTDAMLTYAAQLYGSDFVVTQGSYSRNGPASFGTHEGGGAVDISVIPAASTRVDYPEIEAKIRALRTAGFAAWLREEDEVNPGGGIHIHAIAIGDAELSAAAQQQVDAYFQGLSGLPDSSPDRHHGPIVCAWMHSLGYTDTSAWANAPAINWREALKQAASKYEANTVAATRQLAIDINFRKQGAVEDPSNMCGPLAAAILRDADLLPYSYGPITDVATYWLANPHDWEGKPWSLFPRRDYEVFHFDTAINQFDFIKFPLLPGDFLYTYQGRDGYEHMFIVTEVDAAGRAYTVTNNKQRDLTYIAQKVLLYDPNDLSAGVFKNDWSNSPHVGRTGMQGFDVLRRKGTTLPSGTLYSYIVNPGDTLPSLAYEFGSTLEAIAAQNLGVNLSALLVGQVITIPVNTLWGK